MLHIKIDNPELEEKIKNIINEDKNIRKYTDLIDKAINLYSQHKIIELQVQNCQPKHSIWLDMYHSHTSGSSILTHYSEENLGKVFKKWGYVWAACIRFGLVPINPLVTSFMDFQYILKQSLYNFCFIKEFNSDAFTQEHLFKLRGFMLRLTKEERSACKSVLEADLINYIGFEKANKIIYIIFEEELELDEKTFNSVWEEKFGDNVNIRFDTKED